MNILHIIDNHAPQARVTKGLGLKACGALQPEEEAAPSGGGLSPQLEYIFLLLNC